MESGYLPHSLGRNSSCALRESDFQSSSFQDVFIRVQGDFLRLAGQYEIDAASAVANDSHLAETDHAFAKVGKYRNQHGKVLIDLALGNGHVQLHLPAVRRFELGIEVVSRN